MYMQIVNFKLNGMTDAEYAEACELKFAPFFRDMPGLISKVWIRNPEINTYGGVYMWESKDAMAAYQASSVFQGLLAHPQIAEVSSREFAVMEAPSRRTNGLPVMMASQTWA